MYHIYIGLFVSLSMPKLRKQRQQEPCNLSLMRFQLSWHCSHSQTKCRRGFSIWFHSLLLCETWVDVLTKYKALLERDVRLLAARRWKFILCMNHFVGMWHELNIVFSSSPPRSPLFACNHLFDLYQHAESGQERSCGLSRISQNK